MAAKTLFVGDGSGDTITVELDIGSGAGSNPGFRYNSSTGQLEVSSDGSSFVLWSGASGIPGSMPFFNNTGGQLTAGTLVYISAYNSGQGLYEAAKAIATESNTTTLYATMIVDATVATATAGILVDRKILTAINTDGQTVGRPVYLNTSAGGWTHTLPALENRIQVVGSIIEAHVTTGRIMLKPNAPIWRTQADQI